MLERELLIGIQLLVFSPPIQYHHLLNRSKILSLNKILKYVRFTYFQVFAPCRLNNNTY